MTLRRLRHIFLSIHISPCPSSFRPLPFDLNFWILAMPLSGCGDGNFPDGKRLSWTALNVRPCHDCLSVSLDLSSASWCDDHFVSKMTLASWCHFSVVDAFSRSEVSRYSNVSAAVVYLSPDSFQCLESLSLFEETLIMLCCCTEFTVALWFCM